MMRNVTRNAVNHPRKGSCTAIDPILCRACTAMIWGIAVHEYALFIGVKRSCTAVCRSLPHTRACAGAHVRTQERSCAQWDVPRYIAVHTVQNRRRLPHIVGALARSRPVGPRSIPARGLANPTTDATYAHGPTCAKTRQGWRECHSGRLPGVVPPWAKSQEMAAGTIAVIDSLSFVRKKVLTSLTQVEIKTWKRAINPMLTKLGTDLRNHRILTDPWRRKAESMAKAWKVLFRYGRTLRPSRTNKQVHDWKQATTGMVLAFYRRAYQQRVRTGWRRWASDRAIQPQRWPGKFRSI